MPKPSKLSAALEMHQTLKDRVLELGKVVEEKNRQLEAAASAAMTSVAEGATKIDALRAWVSEIDANIANMETLRRERDGAVLNAMGAAKQFADSANQLPALLHSDLAGVLGGLQANLKSSPVGDLEPEAEEKSS